MKFVFALHLVSLLLLLFFFFVFCFGILLFIAFWLPVKKNISRKTLRNSENPPNEKCRKKGHFDKSN